MTTAIATAAQTMPSLPTRLSPAQYALVKRTVAKGLNDDEFDLFIARCQHTGLDPFKKQICAIVYHADKPDKRKVEFITEIAGYRSLADRSGTYRPAADDDDEVWEIDPEAVDELTNPHGIVSATYYAYKRDARGEWYRVRGKVHWDEYAPIVDEWENRQRTGRKKLQRGNWETKGRHMLMKCAEAHCLRRAWPEQIEGTYVREEMDHIAAHEIEIPASEVIEQQQIEDRRERLGGTRISMLWAAGDPLEGVPIGEFADRCHAWLAQAESPTQVEAWRDSNAVGLQQFWAENKGDALELKRAIEARIDDLNQVSANPEPPPPGSMV